jgi:magnesium-transporting ATPase (P-type)
MLEDWIKKKDLLREVKKRLLKPKIKGKKLKMTETKFSVKNLDNFRKVADELRVLARSTPEDKFLLVTGLK